CPPARPLRRMAHRSTWTRMATAWRLNAGRADRRCRTPGTPNVVYATVHKFALGYNGPKPAQAKAHSEEERDVAGGTVQGYRAGQHRCRVPDAAHEQPGERAGGLRPYPRGAGGGHERRHRLDVVPG